MGFGCGGGSGGRGTRRGPQPGWPEGAGAEGDEEGGRVRLDGRHLQGLAPRRSHRAGQVVSKVELTEHLYAQDFDRDSNLIEVYVRRLRDKLGKDRIQTRRGQGYLFVAGKE